MPDTDKDIFADAIGTLADATSTATAKGYHGVANATIEVQYVVTNRIRPWVATRAVPPSSYAVLEYTVRALEAQIAEDIPKSAPFDCADTLAACLAALKDETEGRAEPRSSLPPDPAPSLSSSVRKTLCLADYAACVAKHFAGVLGA